MLDCVRTATGIAPRDRDLVIVERRRHDLAEMTCKRYVVGPDGIELWPESWAPEYQTPIRMKDLKAAGELGDEISVVAVVLETRQLHFRQDTRQDLLN